MRVAIIPARGGSKRIPRKNIRPFLGQPILRWSVQALEESGTVDRIIVSTEDAEIAELARECGAEVPFMRPHQLADDHTGTLPVVQHAIEALSTGGAGLTAVVCLYATAPLLRGDDLVRGLQELKRDPSCDFVFAGAEFQAPIWRSFHREADGLVQMNWPEHAGTRSQDLPRAFHDAGLFYWGRPESWLTCESILGARCRMVELPVERVQDIDTEGDWQRAELLASALKQREGE
jgi:pseudaminic acid cytidylyltransferase